MTLPAIWGQHDIRDMVRYKDVIKEYSLGSNEEILTFERGEDATIRTKAVLLHHISISHRIVDINVGPEWQCHHRMVKVNGRYMFLNKKNFLVDGFCI
jgi:hypothetical protein